MSSGIWAGFVPTTDLGGIVPESGTIPAQIVRAAPVRAAILDGIVLGLQFGLLGVGLTLVYGLGGILNLAQGQMAVLGAIIVARTIDAGQTTGVAVLAGIAAAGVLGVVLDVTLMKPVYRERGERRVLLGLLLMLGVAFIIEGLLVWRYPIEALSLRIGGEPVEILGVGMRTGQLLASAIALAAGALLVACSASPRSARPFAR